MRRRPDRKHAVAVAAVTVFALLTTAAAGIAGTTAALAPNAKDTLIVLREQIAPQMNPDGTTEPSRVPRRPF